MAYKICNRCNLPATSSMAGPLGLRCQCATPLFDVEAPTTQTLEQPTTLVDVQEQLTFVEQTETEASGSERVAITTDPAGDNQPQDTLLMKITRRAKKAVK
jgi:hypothetical protein